MSDPDFIPDVRIVDGEVRDDHLGHQQILKHVGVDGAAALFRVGAMRPQARLFDRRLQVVLIDQVEVDLLAVRPGLLPERHDDKCGPLGHVDPAFWFRVVRILDECPVGVTAAARAFDGRIVSNGREHFVRTLHATICFAKSGICGKLFLEVPKGGHE